jgi:hypothetical protein
MWSRRHLLPFTSTTPLLGPLTAGVEVISELGGAQFDFRCALMSLPFGVQDRFVVGA